jgi:hypothetical protein
MMVDEIQETAQQQARREWLDDRRTSLTIHEQEMRKSLPKLVNAIQRGADHYAYAYARIVFHHATMMLAIRREMTEL